MLLIDDNLKTLSFQYEIEELRYLERTEAQSVIRPEGFEGAIGVATVKAFWTDVDFAGAERVLIATTSSVSHESKKLCDVRKWPMSFAEADDVKRWARTMWRNAPDLEDEG